VAVHITTAIPETKSRGRTQIATGNRYGDRSNGPEAGPKQRQTTAFRTSDKIF
jgi:hypothetical protein